MIKHTASSLNRSIHAQGIFKNGTFPGGGDCLGHLLSGIRRISELQRIRECFLFSKQQFPLNFQKGNLQMDFSTLIDL